MSRGKVKEVREKLAKGTTVRVGNREYNARKRTTFRFALACVAGQWKEDGNGTRRVNVESEHVHATSVTRNPDGSRSRVTLVRQTVRGNYSDVCEYLDELMNLPCVASLADGSGVVLAYNL